MSTTTRTEAFRRGVRTSVSSGSFAISANGLYTRAQIDALAIPRLDNAMASDDANTMRGLRAMFFGTAADNTTHDWRLYGAWKIRGTTPTDEQFYLGCIAFGTFTLSTAVGLTDSGDVKTTERLADTIPSYALANGGTTVIGPGDFFRKINSGVSVEVWSPADNTPAILGVPELGNPATVFMDLKAASGTIGALLARDI